MRNLKSALGKEEGTKDLGSFTSSNSCKWKKNEPSSSIQSIGDKIEEEVSSDYSHLHQSSELVEIIAECHDSEHAVDEVSALV